MGFIRKKFREKQFVYENTETLFEALQETWYEIPVETMNNYVHSMYPRFTWCYYNDGQYVVNRNNEKVYRYPGEEER